MQAIDLEFAKFPLMYRNLTSGQRRCITSLALRVMLIQVKMMMIPRMKVCKGVITTLRISDE